LIIFITCLKADFPEVAAAMRAGSHLLRGDTSSFQEEIRKEGHRCRNIGNNEQHRK
jgi:hypothetical protein